MRLDLKSGHPGPKIIYLAEIIAQKDQTQNGLRAATILIPKSVGKTLEKAKLCCFFMN